MKMKAVLIHDVTPAEDIMLTEVPVPKVKSGWVLVRIRAFGMNHSEQILRLSEIQAPYICRPVIPGIECVGTVEETAPDSRFVKGQRVIAMMGGMGRSFNGSYAEYALLPEHHVFTADSSLPWEALAAVPETWFTAWGSLFECLQLRAQDTLLIRGATCALGYAAIQLGKALGCRVIATTHREEKLPLLAAADQKILDDGRLTGKIRGVTRALDLVGPKYLKDTLTAVEKGSLVCQTGILGGVYALNGFDPIKDIPNGVYLTGFFSNYPDQKTVDDMFAFFREHEISPHPGTVFPFEEIREACMAMDAGRVNGKIVVVLPEGPEEKEDKGPVKEGR